MLLQIFATFGLALFGAGSAVKEGVELNDARDKARAENKYYYYDPNGKKRSLRNREPIFMTVVNHHLVDMGAKTRAIYHDFTKDKVDEANERLKERGQKWIWKQYNGNRYKPWDPESGHFCFLIGKRLCYMGNFKDKVIPGSSGEFRNLTPEEAEAYSEAISRKECCF